MKKLHFMAFECVSFSELTPFNRFFFIPGLIEEIRVKNREAKNAIQRTERKEY